MNPLIGTTSRTPTTERHLTVTVEADRVVLFIHNPTESAGWDIAVTRDEWKAFLTARLRELEPSKPPSP